MVIYASTHAVFIKHHWGQAAEKAQQIGKDTEQLTPSTLKTYTPHLRIVFIKFIVIKEFERYYETRSCLHLTRKAEVMHNKTKSTKKRSQNIHI